MHEDASTRSSPRHEGARTSDAFLWFARLWAMSGLVQQMIYLGGARAFWTHGAPTSLLGVLLLSSLLWLLLARNPVLPLAAYAVIQLVQCFGSMPFIPNHILLEGSINASILLAVGVASVRSRRWSPDASEVFALFAPAARLQVILLYLIAVLHKLNRDFFDPEFSAVTWVIEDAGISTDFAGADGVMVGLVVVTLLFETAIPLLFLFRRTRTLGILAGLLFHVPLSLHSLVVVASFTTFLLPCFFLFAPELLTRIADRIDEWIRDRWRLRHGLLVLIRTLLFVMLALVVLTQAGIETTRIRAAIFILDLILIGIVSVWFLIGILPTLGRPVIDIDRMPHALRPAPVLWLMPVVLLLNGMLPYLGLKTELTFSMYSNLRVEDGRSNHLFMPTAFKVFDLQDDLVEIESSSNEWLALRSRNGELINHHELRRRLQMAPAPWDITYLHDGTSKSASLDGDGVFTGDPGLLEPLNWYQETFITYRLVDKEGPMRSRH